MGASVHKYIAHNMAILFSYLTVNLYCQSKQKFWVTFITFYCMNLSTM